MMLSRTESTCAAIMLALLYSLLLPQGESFSQLSFVVLSKTFSGSKSALQMSSSWDDNLRELKSIQESQTRNALIDALFGVSSEDSSSSLLPVHLSGQARLPVLTNRTKEATSNRISLVLTQEQLSVDNLRSTSALFVPLASQAQLKLLSFAAARRQLSKSVLLGLNTLLVNRDNALFDNLPWSEWSIDPQQRNRDAAGNPIDSKFHLGKRDAYNRFMGKDWQGRSVAIGNMALRLKYMLEADEEIEESNESPTTFDQEETQKSLATRMLQLQIRELQMELADVESQLAIARNDGANKESRNLEQEQVKLLEKIASAREDLASVIEEPKREKSRFGRIMERIASWTTNDGKNEAPYRGAMGYAPRLDSKKDIEDGLLPYTSPYDLLKEILEDQLNAKVVGCVLENTSLLKGNLALGGAILLQRITPTKTVEMLGESIEYNDYEEEFGNEGVKAGETMIVECDCDEAIALALVYNAPLKVESDIFGRAAMLAEPNSDLRSSSGNIMEVFPMWKTADPDVQFQVEGEKDVPAKLINPISIPRTTTSLFDEIFEDKPVSSSTSMFPTDNPIKSLGEFDALSNEDKAKSLLEMSNFAGRLPRPRVVRTAKDNPLDKLLLPLIDESVRRQYYIREAEKMGDFERATELRNEKSRRQIARERANEALQGGREDDWEQWESEAEFLESLRADVTQDEGSYSRFLDRDYWYEKDRQATAKRVNRSKFGTLLEGIE